MNESQKRACEPTRLPGSASLKPIEAIVRAVAVKRPDYIPALGRDVLTPLYDVAIRLTLPERRFKQHVLTSASISSGMKVIDIGSGTGTLLVMGARMAESARFVGVDPDPLILRRSRAKFLRQRVSANLVQASGTSLPFADGSLDRVLSTLAFHHLDMNAKREALRESLRVLRTGGEIHIADFGAPSGAFTRLMSFLVELIGREHVHEQFRGLLPKMMMDAGFHEVEETGAFRTPFGVLRVVRGVRQ